MTDETLVRVGALQAAEVAATGLTIYDSLDDHPELIYELPVLEARLRDQLLGRSFTGPIRTRNKTAKQAAAEALGYPTPTAFRRVLPRFPSQNLDVLVYQADNFQPWNQAIDPLRRYAFLRPDDAGRIVGVRVVTGEVLAVLDRTGTLTSKYQAKRRSGRTGSMLVVPRDTGRLQHLLISTRDVDRLLRKTSSSDLPQTGVVLPIEELHRRLRRLEGKIVVDPGAVQDRLRGEALQQAASETLGIGRYQNLGHWLISLRRRSKSSSKRPRPSTSGSSCQRVRIPQNCSDTTSATATFATRSHTPT